MTPLAPMMRTELNLLEPDIDIWLSLRWIDAYGDVTENFTVFQPAGSFPTLFLTSLGTAFAKLKVVPLPLPEAYDRL